MPSFAKGLSIFVPPPAFAIIALPLCAFSYQTWNYVPFQLCFFMGLWVAYDMFLREADHEQRRPIAIMAVALALSQAIFLRFSYALALGYELTEIREFAITLAITAYCFILARRFSRAGTSAHIANTV